MAKNINHEAHTSPQKKGMGDSYGTGYKQKPVIPRSISTVNPVAGKKLKKPPKSLA